MTVFDFVYAAARNRHLLGNGSSVHDRGLILVSQNCSITTAAFKAGSFGVLRGLLQHHQSSTKATERLRSIYAKF